MSYSIHRVGEALRGQISTSLKLMIKASIFSADSQFLLLLALRARLHYYQHNFGTLFSFVLEGGSEHLEIFEVGLSFL